MDVAEELLVGKRILVIWYQAHNPEGMQPVLEELRRRAGEAGHVLLEHAERLVLASYPESSFDVVLSGVFPPTTLSHSSELLAEAARILKPSGSVLIQEPVTLHGQTAGLRLQSKLLSTMKLSGFVEVTECTVENHFGEEFRTGLEKCGIPVTNDDLSHIGVVQVHAKKPAYEVGASAQLSFATHLKKNVKPTVTAETAKIWSLSSNDVLDEDIDLMDSDSLLIEEDLLRPNPESLRSECGPNSGKKKACKNCTCGFAESLDNNIQTRQVTSSCGNCYLGDAFRCGSCPYLGMPAFKPGDQVRLTDRQLRPDQ